MRTLIALAASLAVSLSACANPNTGGRIYIEPWMSPEQIEHMRADHRACEKDLESRYGNLFGLGFEDGIPNYDLTFWMYDCMKSKGYGYRPPPPDRPA